MPPASPGQLAIDEPTIRLEYLTRLQRQLTDRHATQALRRDWLVAEIDRLRADRQSRLTPFRQQIVNLDDKIHKLFGKAINRPKLGKSSRFQIEQDYNRLQRLALTDRRPKEVYKYPTLEPNNTWIPASAVLKPPIDPATKANLRRLYLELAAIYHPDKHPDSAEHARIMVEINAAYETGDLAALLAISEGCHLENTGAGRSADLFKQIHFLQKRIMQMDEIIHMLEHQPEWEYDFLRKAGSDPHEIEVKRYRQQLAQFQKLADLLASFDRKNIGIVDFIDTLTQICFSIER